MAHDLTPCPRLDGSRVCMRSLGASRCHYCGRDLPMSHPTVIEDRVRPDAANAFAADAAKLFASDSIGQAVVQAAAAGKLPPPPAPLTCPLCSFEAAGGSGCLACGASFYRVVRLRDPEGQVVAAARPEVVAAARRIKRALHAEADRAAGIDTSHLGGRGPMPAARLAWFREQAGSALSLREADELIEALPELLDEVDRLRALASPAAPGDAAAPTTFALALSYDPAISPVVLEHCLACGMTLGQLPGGGRTCVRCDVDDEGTDG